MRNPKTFWLIFLNLIPGSFERTNLSPKDYFWREEKLLKNLLKKNSRKVEFPSLKERKFWKRISRWKCFPQNVPLDTKTVVLRDLRKTSSKYPKFFSFSVQKRENSLFGKKFHQTFLWTHRKHFSQRCEKHNKPQKLFAESPSFFQKLSQNDDWWNFTKIINLTEILHRARKRNFDEVVSLVCLTASRFFKCSETLEKHLFFKKQICPISSRCLGKNFERLAEKNASRPNFSRWLLGKDISNQTLFFYKTRFSLKFFSWQKEYCFDNFAWLIPLNGLELSAECLKVMADKKLDLFL